MLDGVYRCGADGAAEFVESPAPYDEQVQAVLHTTITRLMKLLTRRGVLVEDMAQTCLAEPDADGDGDEARTLRPLQAAAVTYRIAFGPRYRLAVSTALMFLICIGGTASGLALSRCAGVRAAS